LARFPGRRPALGLKSAPVRRHDADHRRRSFASIPALFFGVDVGLVDFSRQRDTVAQEWT